MKIRLDPVTDGTDGFLLLELYRKHKGGNNKKTSVPSDTPQFLIKTTKKQKGNPMKAKRKPLVPAPSYRAVEPEASSPLRDEGEDCCLHNKKGTTPKPKRPPENSNKHHPSQYPRGKPIRRVEEKTICKPKPLVPAPTQMKEKTIRKRRPIARRPSTGWLVVEVIDANRADPLHLERIVCDRCDKRLRWVVVLCHPAFPGFMHVGAKCAERLCEKES